MRNEMHTISPSNCRHMFQCDVSGEAKEKIEWNYRFNFISYRQWLSVVSNYEVKWNIGMNNMGFAFDALLNRLNWVACVYTTQCATLHFYRQISTDSILQPNIYLHRLIELVIRFMRFAGGVNFAYDIQTIHSSTSAAPFMINGNECQELSKRVRLRESHNVCAPCAGTQL